MFKLLFILPAWASLTLAKTVQLNWDITWVNANPDGLKWRPVIGVNGKFPPPIIEADLGDEIVLTVNNQLGNETTGLHFHGQTQYGTPHMDGPSLVTQCPIPPGETFTYQFEASPAGSYWYHSHNKGQYPDGLRGPMVVHEKSVSTLFQNVPNLPDIEGIPGGKSVENLPTKNDLADLIDASYDVDEEYIMMLSDWYHEQMGGPQGLLNYYLGPGGARGMGPLPQSTLINDKSTETYSVQPGKRYLFRIIDVSTLAAHFVQFQGHNMTIVAVDGVRTKPTPAQTIRLTAGQRYDVIITGIENPKANYAFITQMDVEMLGGPQPDSLTIANGILQYNPKFGTPQKLTTHGTPIDDFGLSPLDGTPLLENPDQIISLDMTFHDTLAQGELVQRAYVNGVSYISPTVPTLYSMMTLGKNALNPEVYGKNTNSFVLQPGQIIELNVQNMDSGPHPLHLHMHNMQLVYRSEVPFNSKTAKLPKSPMMRDTIEISPMGYLVLRFKADNAGVSLFHCHIEWHVEAGKTVSFIEAPELLQKMNIKLPADHIRACSLQNIPIQGNCEGNTVNPTNTTACPSQEMAVNLGAFVALPPSPPSHPSPVSPPSGHASGLSSGLPSGFPSQGRAGSLF